MTVKKIKDQLMGLSITELNEVLDMVSAIKTLKAKAGINVGDRVYVVQKTKKTPGTVRKINQTRAVVEYEGNVNFEKEKTIRR